MTASRRVYVVNESTLVSDADARKMASACNKQVRDHAAPAWDLERVVVGYHSGDLASVQDEAPPGSWVMALMDDPDQAGALAWHSVDDQSRIYGEVFARPSLEDGKSTALAGPYAVSASLSHEVLEALCDRYCTGWADTGRGYLLAQEVADPVEADAYAIDGVAVSNFVLPSWFDATSGSAGPFDCLGRLTQPFAMTKGGYWVQMKAGAQTQQFRRTAAWLTESGFDVRGSASGPQLVFSPQMPQWRRELKAASGRNALKRGVLAGKR